MTPAGPETTPSAAPSATASATASANTNIALIKYWGKADASQSIPTTSSLSLTLGGTRTVTTVSFDGGQDGVDALTINGATPGATQRQRVVRFLDLVRSRSGLGLAASVTSTSTVPLAAGLASSAAGFAALAAAASAAAGMDLDLRDLSRLARRGSGSATRSIFGGLALWHAGHDDVSSYAEPVQDHPDLAMVVAMLSQERKSISSTDAMRTTMDTSPLYPAWVQASAVDLREALAAVASGDLERLGQVVEANALGMHAAMMAARPAVVYWQPQTLKVLEAVRGLRAEGLPAWATIDAGPNVKVLTAPASAQAVQAALSQHLPGVSLWVRRPGGGVRIEAGVAGQAGQAGPEAETA